MHDIGMKNAFHRQYLQWLMSHDVSRPLKLSPSSWAKIIILTRMPKCLKKSYLDWILICFVCRLLLYIFDCKILKKIYIYS